jgi:hypothetical protein
MLAWKTEQREVVMGLPGNFVGNAGDQAFAALKQLADEFIDAVIQVAEERSISRGFLPILRPSNFQILADTESVHIVYTNNGAGALPAVNITDFTENSITRAFTGSEAGAIVEHQLGYTNCEIVTVSRGLVDKSKDEQHAAMMEEAQDYINHFLAEEQRRSADRQARYLCNTGMEAMETGITSRLSPSTPPCGPDHSWHRRISNEPRRFSRIIS